MSNFLKGHKLTECIITAPDGSYARDIRMDTISINFFESILDYSTQFTMTIGNTKGLFSNLPVRGGCKVTLNIDHPSGKFTFGDSDPLYVASIGNHISESNREVFTLDLNRKDFFLNFQRKLNRKYKGKISDTVRKILVDDLKVTKDVVTFDETSNNYDFMGNYKNPLQTIIWLCPKSIPVINNSKTSGSAGFLFFETLDGYHFTSVDTIFEKLKDAEKNSNIFTYQMMPGSNALMPENNFRIISQPIWSQADNLTSQVRQGMYESKNIFFDINARFYESNNYKLFDSLKDQMKLSNNNFFLPSDVLEGPSRHMFSIVDKGTLSAKGDLTTPQNQQFHQGHSVARYNVLFSQTLTITVPLNIQLRAGSVIYCKFPKLSVGQGDYGKDPNSGYYLITKLRHSFGAEGNYTGLELVRDSYGEYT